MPTVTIPYFANLVESYPPSTPTPALTVECRDTNQVSDGYHTFGELYEHRLLLFCAFLKLNGPNFKSRLHHDGSGFDGWFIAGCTVNGKQITYHLPDRLWDLCPAEAVERAPEWDGHTSDDVLNRIKDWIKI